MNVVGYVRLSRDDDRKNYSSIENQKAKILEYAIENDLTISKFYEDDNISGYKFDRPAFSEMLDKLEEDIDVVIAKDLSRIGRNNAKVLMLLDRFQELEKRLILIDDAYDTYESADDIIGIKTWYNERYVKDASKKIRSVVRMKQKNGEYISHAPFGYYVQNKKYFIRDNEAEVVKKIFELYISGYGYRMIANQFNDEGVNTPSVMIMQNRFNENRGYNLTIATKWSDTRVRDILKNDFYIGKFRTKKRERKLIHGHDKRIPRDEQYVFENHHDAIIDNKTFDLTQELMKKRQKTNYRGSKSPNDISLYGSILECEDCGSKLVRIRRNTKSKIRNYYLCATYNYNGTNFCSSHLIDEEKLNNVIKQYINVCKSEYKSLNDEYKMSDYESNKKDIYKQINKKSKKLEELKSKLKSIISMKINDLSKYGDNTVAVEEAYSEMQNTIVNNIKKLEVEISELSKSVNSDYEVKKKTIEDAYEKLMNINNELTRKDIEELFDKIVVDSNGEPKFLMKLDISNYVKFDSYEDMNKKELTVQRHVLELIQNEERAYTSAKYLSAKVTELGYKKSKRSILPYINLAIGDGVLEATDNPLKPYNILMNRNEISNVINSYTYPM